MRVFTQHGSHLLPGALDRFQIGTTQFDFQRRGEAEEFGTTEIDLCARVCLHGLTHFRGLRRLQFLAAAIGHDDADLADVLAAVGRAGIQPRAAATDAVKRTDTFVIGMFFLEFAHQSVGLAQWRARRQLDRHFEAVLRQLRDKVRTQQRHQHHRADECRSSQAQHQPRLAQRAWQQLQVAALGTVIRHHRQVAGLAHDRTNHG